MPSCCSMVPKEKSVVGETWEDIVGLAEDVAGSTEKGCGFLVEDTVDTESLAERAGEGDGIEVSGRDELDFSRSAFLTDAEDQMMGIEVGALTEDGVVSCDFGGGENLDCEVGSVGGDEFEVEGVGNETEDQMMGTEVGAATEDGVVSCDFGGGESLDWEIGDDGGEERGFCGARVEGAGVYVARGVGAGRGFRE
jgi:hypothetical protein